MGKKGRGGNIRQGSGFNLPAGSKPTTLRSFAELGEHKDNFPEPPAQPPLPNVDQPLTPDALANDPEFQRLFEEKQRIGRTIIENDSAAGIVFNPGSETDVTQPKSSEAEELRIADHFQEDFENALRSSIQEATRLGPIIDEIFDGLFESGEQQFTHLKNGSKSRGQRKEWVQRMLVKLEAGDNDTLNYPDDPENMRAQRREAQVRLLAQIAAESDQSQWIAAAEADAAYLYRTSQGREVSEGLNQGHLVGHFFEQLSRNTRINNSDAIETYEPAINAMPIPERNSDLLAERKRLTERAIASGIIVELKAFKDKNRKNIQRESVVAEIISRQVFDTRIDEWQAVVQKAKKAKIMIYLDSPLYQQPMEGERIMIQYVEKGKTPQGYRAFEWVAIPEELAGKVIIRAEITALLKRMNEMADACSEEISIPDHFITGGKQGEIIGVVEDKNYTVAELAAYIETLKHERTNNGSDHDQANQSAGVFVSEANLNHWNQVYGLGEKKYNDVVVKKENLGAGIYFDLDFYGETRFAGAINNGVTDNVEWQQKTMLKVLRLPGDSRIDEHMISNLQFELAQRGQIITVQQFHDFNRADTEILSREYMRSLDFVEELERNYSRIPHNQENTQVLQSRNIKARAYALGITNLAQFFAEDQIGDFTEGQRLYRDDVIDEMAQSAAYSLFSAIEAGIDEVELEPIGELITKSLSEGETTTQISNRRKELLDRLKADYLAFQTVRVERRQEPTPTPLAGSHVPARAVTQETQAAAQPVRIPSERLPQTEAKEQLQRVDYEFLAPRIDLVFTTLEYIALLNDKQWYQKLKEPKERLRISQGGVIVFSGVSESFKATITPVEGLFSLKIELTDKTIENSIFTTIRDLKGIKMEKTQFYINL